MAGILSGLSGAVQAFIANRKAKLVATINDTPPFMRQIEVGYAELYRTADNSYAGAFLPEIYELAKVGRLQNQREAAAWAGARLWTPAVIAALRTAQPALFAALYHDDNTRKTAFELAVFPSKESLEIGAYMTREYTALRQARLPMPRMVPKYSIKRDYLATLPAGLHTNVPGSVNPSQIGIMINLTNPISELTGLERGLHYTGQWAAWVSTASAVASVVLFDLALGLTPLWMAGTLAAATWIAHSCGNFFGQYSVAESLFRDINWMRDPVMRQLGNKLDRRKTAETVLQILALSSVVATTMFSTWMLVTGFWAPITAVPYVSLTAAKYFTAGFASLTAGLGVWTGKVFANHYFWRFGFYDTQLDFATPAMVAAVAKLGTPPADTVRRDFEVAVRSLREMMPTLSTVERSQLRDFAPVFLNAPRQTDPAVSASSIPASLPVRKLSLV